MIAQKPGGPDLLAFLFLVRIKTFQIARFRDVELIVHCKVVNNGACISIASILYFWLHSSHGPLHP